MRNSQKSWNTRNLNETRRFVFHGYYLVLFAISWLSRVSRGLPPRQSSAPPPPAGPNTSWSRNQPMCSVLKHHADVVFIFVFLPLGQMPLAFEHDGRSNRGFRIESLTPSNRRFRTLVIGGISVHTDSGAACALLGVGPCAVPRGLNSLPT